MFENTGEQLRGVALCTFLLHIIASITGGIVMMVADDDLIFAGIGVIVVGILIGYTISLIIAAFGELVCSATASVWYLKQLNNQNNDNVSYTNNNASKTDDIAALANKATVLDQEKIPAWKRVQMEGKQ